MPWHLQSVVECSSRAANTRRTSPALLLRNLILPPTNGQRFTSSRWPGAGVCLPASETRSMALLAPQLDRVRKHCNTDRNREVLHLQGQLGDNLFARGDGGQNSDLSLEEFGDEDVSFLVLLQIQGIVHLYICS
mmetsp:Transcript_2066/g.6168  ORF Transcript_2066/g.6168 Transcript_2066/m.6168 type:complete len:134 (+) Transcript_2066:1414-1815(+)